MDILFIISARVPVNNLTPNNQLWRWKLFVCFIWLIIIFRVDHDATLYYYFLTLISSFWCLPWMGFILFAAPISSLLVLILYAIFTVLGGIDPVVGVLILVTILGGCGFLAANSDPKNS
jgi:hypothetical protein